MPNKDPMRVLGVVGSPRRGGNTDILVDHVLKGARDAGAVAEKVMLNDLHIAPCHACYACEAAGQCIHTDDMEGLFEKLHASGVWVLGTPVYWWGPSAQMKAFMDRWFAKVRSRDNRDILSGHSIVLAVPMGDTDAGTARHVVGMFEDSLRFVKSEVVDSVLAPGAYDAGDVKKMQDVLERARLAGEHAVSGR